MIPPISAGFIPHSAHVGRIFFWPEILTTIL